MCRGDLHKCVSPDFFFLKNTLVRDTEIYTAYTQAHKLMCTYKLVLSHKHIHTNSTFYITDGVDLKNTGSQILNFHLFGRVLNRSLYIKLGSENNRESPDHFRVMLWGITWGRGHILAYLRTYFQICLSTTTPWSINCL